MGATAMTWAKRTLSSSRLAGILVRLLDGVGAHRSALRLDRSRTREVVVVGLPDPRGSSRARVRMYLLGGRDQVARALDADGWYGFEPPLPSVVAGLVQQAGGVLLDVGANTGLYSLIAVAAHPSARAIAFEPVPSIAALLEANVVLNGDDGRIRLDDAAIGDRTGRATLHLPPPQADGTIETSASLEEDFKETIESTLEVRTSTLDDAWQAHGAPAVTMIKIDVEGAEARVLRGGRAVLEACGPVVSVEVLGRLDAAPLEALRSDLGYLDVTLGPHEAVVGRPAVVVDPGAPNHLLVPPPRIGQVLSILRTVPDLVVRDLRSERRPGDGSSGTPAPS